MPGLGPKRVRQLHDALGVESLDDLREAAEQGRIKDVPGFGAKAQENVLAALAAGADGSAETRLVLSHALGLGEELVAGLREHPAALRVELAGSARRWADSCKDLDIVAATSDPAALVEAFAALPGLDDVSSSGEAGARALTYQGLPIDLRIVPEESFGNLLQHFTGSARHNEALRIEAVKRGLHVSEYGILDDADGETRTRASPRRRSTSCWGWRSCRRSCARTAASCRPRGPGSCRSWCPWTTFAATCTRTRLPRTGATRSTRWPRRRRSAATSTWRSPTTRPRTASATT